MKRIRVAIIALCSLMMVLPTMAIPFFRSDISTSEGRRLAEFPALWDAEEGLNGHFAEDFEAWLCDHFAFRGAAVRANAALNYRLLRTSPNDDVIVGRDGWLYYGDTAADYTGEAPLTPGELETISGNLRAMAESLEARGAKLYVAIIPNKSTVYPQYMPARYARREDGGNIQRLREAVAGLPLTWVDLTEPLTRAAGEAQVYYRTDTHWNDLGAAVAAEALLGAMGRPVPAYTVTGEREARDGDLTRLMGLEGRLAERSPVVGAGDDLPEADYSGHRLAVKGPGQGNLLLFRDSFGTTIGPLLCRAYGASRLLWQTPLETWHPCDDALVLLAERNIRLFLMDPPELREAGEEEETDDEAYDEDKAEPDDEDGDLPEGEMFDDEDEDLPEGEMFDDEDEDLPEDEMFDDEDDEGDFTVRLPVNGEEAAHGI